MLTTESRPVISSEEFDENATARLSDFNALKEMFHELKDEFESLKMENTMEAMAPTSGDASDQMTSLQCFNSKDMIKPDQYDMEPGTFHNWNELFVRYMMSIDRKWGLILTGLERKDAAYQKEDISCIHYELKMPLEIKAWPITNYMGISWCSRRAKQKVELFRIRSSFHSRRTGKSTRGVRTPPR